MSYSLIDRLGPIGPAFLPGALVAVIAAVAGLVVVLVFGRKQDRVKDGGPAHLAFMAAFTAPRPPRPGR